MRLSVIMMTSWYSCIFEVPWVFKMCHLSVVNLSENCQLCKTVRKLSIMCQKTVSNLSYSKICQKSVRKVQKMYQKSVSLHKCVIIVSTCCTKWCHKTVILPHSDTFLTHFHHQIWSILGNIGRRKLSQICQKSISDTFLTHYEGNISKMFP